MTDPYWTNYEACLDKIVTGRGATVAGVIEICNEHFEPSSGEAFFPGGADRDLLGTLMDRGGWSTVWVEAHYYFAIRDANGDVLSYIEGDIERGNCRART